MEQSQREWMTGPEVWAEFVRLHPELGYRAGRMNFHNFLRYHRDRLVQGDAIRRAKRRFWIAHRERFFQEAFNCATDHGTPVDSAGINS